ncbi:hypothetical protein LSTR_LSTR005950 [Laodelphax striatellus]|uniref:Uncharacterized protein n=1 Tax=Laodelphax striatellus TaxID=195883 RepID=A0A482WFQ8_LAOST|nr:hypothetical protein LSTR_LSTR005950 [Laodelphax striatellus]
MLTTKQRVDKVKQWIRQSCNPDLFNVATVYDEVEGVSVQDCSKCSFSSPGSASGVLVSVSQIYSHKNNVTEYFESQPIVLENSEKKIVETGKFVNHAGKPKNNYDGQIEVDEEDLEYLENGKTVEDQEGLENLVNNFLEIRKSAKNVEGVEYLRNDPVESIKSMKDEETLEYLENIHLKNVNNGNGNDELENVDGRPVVDLEARELLGNGEELGDLKSKIVENVRERGIDEDGEETCEKNGYNVRKLKENPRKGKNLKKNQEREKSCKRRVDKEEEEKEEVGEEVEEGKLEKNPRRGRKLKKNQEREKSCKRRVEKEESEEKGVEEEEVEGRAEEEKEEEVEKGKEIKVQEEREVKGGEGAEGCSKRNSGGRRQTKSNCKGKNNLKNNSRETQNFETSSSSGKTLKNWKNMEKFYQQNNGSEEEGEGRGRYGEEEGGGRESDREREEEEEEEGRGRDGEEEGGEEEKERKDDVIETKENIETNEEEKKNEGQNRFSTKNKISSQGIRVYINKKKPSWKKFIRTPCSTWTAVHRNVEKSNKKKSNTDKYLREINKFIKNLDLDEQLRKGRKRRRRSKDDEDDICTPQERRRKGTDLEEEGEEHSSDTDWANEKNIDLRQTFVKNRQRFKSRYTDSFQKLQVTDLENTPKANRKNTGKRRRLLDCYSIWDGNKEENVHKKESGKTERVYEEDGIGYNFEKYSEGCGKVLDDLFKKERMEEEGKTTKKRRKRKRRGENGGEEQNVKGNEETLKDNQGKLGENNRIQDNVENMNENFGQVDTMNGEDQSVRGIEEISKENQGKMGENVQIQDNVENMNDNFGLINNKNFQIRMSEGEKFENKQILNNPVLDAEGYLLGFGFLDSTEKENSIENYAENKSSRILSDTVCLRDDQPEIVYGAVQSSNNPVNDNVQCEDSVPVILNKTVQFESIVHDDLHQDISVKSKYTPTPPISNAINNVNPLQNIPVQSKNTKPNVFDKSEQPDNIFSEIVQTENIGHLNERNSILKTINDGVICDFNKNATMSEKISNNVDLKTVNDGVVCDFNKSATMSEKISNNEDLSGGNIENKISSDKPSQMPELRIVLKRCDELIRKSVENRRENQDVDKEEVRNEKIIEKRNRIFVTNSQKTSKQEKFIAKYVSSIKKASNRARKYRKLKVKVVKSEKWKETSEKSNVFTEKIIEKKFNMTKFCRKSLTGSSGWSDIDERLKQIDVKRTFTKLKVVKLCEQDVENSRNHGKVGVNNEIGGVNHDISGGNHVKSDKNNGNSRKNSKDMKISSERKKLTDLGLGRNQSTKEDEKKRQNKSKQNKKEEGEPKRKLAKIDFSKRQGSLGRMDGEGEEDKENWRNTNAQINQNNVNFRRMADKENKLKLNKKGEENSVKVSGKALNGSTNTRKNYEKRMKDGEKMRKVEGNLCERNSTQETKEVAHINCGRVSGIEDNIMIAREYSKRRDDSTKDETEQFKMNNVNSNGIICENVDTGAAEKADEQIEIIPESLDLESDEKVEKTIEKSNLNIEIIHESLEMEGEKSFEKLNHNIEIIPENLDLEGHETVTKNNRKLHENIDIIPESLDLEGHDKNVEKLNENIEIIPESLDLEGRNKGIVGENLNLKAAGRSNEHIIDIIQERRNSDAEIMNSEINRGNSPKIVDENLEIGENCLNLDAEIVGSGDWFIENSAPLDDEKNSISVMRHNRKFGDKNLVNEEDVSCENNQGVMECGYLEYNIDRTISNCGALNNVHNNKIFNKDHVEMDNFERNVNQELDEGLEMNENLLKENTQQEMINQNKFSKKQSNGNIEVNNNQSICRRFERYHSYEFNEKHARNDTNETVNIDETDEFGIENNGIINDCVRDRYGAKYCGTNNTYGTDKNHGTDENYDKENYGTINTYGTNSTTHGTSKNHQNSFNSNNFYEKLLEEDEEFFTNENLMTIDSVNNMEEDIKFNELEIQLKGDLIEEFCEMLQDLEDDERFDKNLLKSFIRNLRGASERKLAFDTMGNVLVDDVKVVPDLEENRENYEENENFGDNICSMDVENEENLLKERIGKVVQTMETQEDNWNNMEARFLAIEDVSVLTLTIIAYGEFTFLPKYIDHLITVIDQEFFVYKSYKLLERQQLIEEETQNGM